MATKDNELNGARTADRTGGARSVSHHDAARPDSGKRATRSPERRGSETKGAFKTSEFFALVGATLGIAIAGLTIGGDGGLADFFTSEKTWLFLTIIAVGYMLSRGLAKAAISHGHGETKPSFKTTELIVYVLAVLGVLATAAATSSDAGVADSFNADRAWLYVAILTAGYMVSRGLSKLGDRHVEEDNGGNQRGITDKLGRAVGELKS